MRVTFNEHSRRVFAGLPARARDTITAWQQSIDDWVRSVSAGAVATSGFRDAAYNRGVSTRRDGAENSRHLWGLARDYVRDSVDYHRLVMESVRAGYRVIREPTCVHVEVA